MLQPIGKRIIVTPIESKHGNIVVAGAKPTQFRVIRIGDEVTKVRRHDIIYLDRYQGAEIEHEKEKFLVIDESSILAKLD